MLVVSNWINRCFRCLSNKIKENDNLVREIKLKIIGLGCFTCRLVFYVMFFVVIVVAVFVCFSYFFRFVCLLFLSLLLFWLCLIWLCDVKCTLNKTYQKSNDTAR